MEFKGTKGNWQTKYGDVYSDINEDNDAISDVYNYGDEEGKANALLISKAPEMLEALITIRRRYNIQPDFEREIDQLIKEATEL